MKKTSKPLTAIERFAKPRRLKTAKDAVGDIIIPGRTGHVYEHGEGLFGMMFTSEMHPTGHRWQKVRTECKAVRMTLSQDGENEGTFLFDPANEAQAKVATDMADVRPKRLISPEHLAKLRAGRQNVHSPLLAA